MMPKWQKLASLTQEICTLWFQFFGAVFASKGYPFKNILDKISVTFTQFLRSLLYIHLRDNCIQFLYLGIYIRSEI